MVSAVLILNVDLILGPKWAIFLGWRNVSQFSHLVLPPVGHGDPLIAEDLPVHYTVDIMK